MSCACITLPPALAPSAAYYALMGRYAYARIAMHAPYDKRRKETHRYEVADTRGRLTLTVPVQPPHGIARAQWTDVRLSGHGRWQDVHATSLASAYGRTPFYEFYIDRLAPALFPEEGTPLEAQIRALNAAVCASSRTSACSTPSSTSARKRRWRCAPQRYALRNKKL